MGELSRRAFLKLAAAGSAAAAAGYGTKALHRLISEVEPPRDAVPGEVTVYATTCRECPAGCGVHAWHRDGRVIKVEGNPDHPISHGGLCARGQSALQGLYDPDRLKHVLHRPRLATAATGGAPAFGPAQKSDWPTAIREIAARLRKPGAKVAVISDLQTGTLAEIMGAFAKTFGGEPPVFHEPFNCETLRRAHGLLFGEGYKDPQHAIIPDYRIDECELVVSFGADFLDAWISPVQYAHRFAKMHAYDPVRKTKGRMVYIGPRLSMTAANADEFIAVHPGAMAGIAAAMARTIIERGWGKASIKVTGGSGQLSEFLSRIPSADDAASMSGVPAQRIVDLADRFARSRSLALGGAIAGMVYLAFPTMAFATGLLNFVAGQAGQAMDLSRPHALSLAMGYVEAMTFLRDRMPLDLLIIHNANPSLIYPGWESEFAKAKTVVYLGTMPDESAELADWVLPIDSPLESWGDYEPYAGSVSLIQPAMSRLHDTRAAGDILLALAEEAGTPLRRQGAAEPPADTREWLRQRLEETRTRVAPAVSTDEFWRDSLRQGTAADAAKRPSPQVSVTLDNYVLSSFGPHTSGDLAEVTKTAIPSFWDFLRKHYRLDAQYLALWAWPSGMLFDGRTANRGWLQEAPDPVSTAQWGTWIDIHPKTAGQLGLSTGDLVSLAVVHSPPNPTVDIMSPIRVTEDVVPGTVAIPFGQGHTAMGRNAAGRGVPASVLLTTGESEGFSLVSLRPTGRKAAITFATATQEQHGREIIQWVKLSKLRGMKEGDGEHFSLPLPEGYDPAKDTAQPRRYTAHRWAMVIDLDRCIGCGACAVACQAENNVAVVGPAEAAKGRIMNWLRIVPYRHPEDPRRVGFLPLLCQHCDCAPCEPVCPVYASVHSEEGLNAQVYNRCIGTRYCSNNCPYKVRRFNWLSHDWPSPLDWQLNPDVTVRERGVMEKCTFCVQRIRRAKQRARREGRAIRDGEIQPACGQSCPTKAIVFGDLLDADSRVSRLTRGDPRRYHVLEELNTKPAVTYLKRIENDE